MYSIKLQYVYYTYTISQLFKFLFLAGFCYSAQLGVAASASATTLRTPHHRNQVNLDFKGCVIMTSEFCAFDNFKSTNHRVALTSVCRFKSQSQGCIHRGDRHLNFHIA